MKWEDPFVVGDVWVCCAGEEAHHRVQVLLLNGLMKNCAPTGVL